MKKAAVAVALEPRLAASLGRFGAAILGGLLPGRQLGAGVLLTAAGYLTGVVEYWLSERIRRAKERR